MALDRRQRERMPCGCEMRLGMESISWVRCPLHEAAPKLLAAAKTVLAGLTARIDAAPGDAVPVFDGIADLHTAIAKAEGRD